MYEAKQVIIISIEREISVILCGKGYSIYNYNINRN